MIIILAVIFYLHYEYFSCVINVDLFVFEYLLNYGFINQELI